MLILTILIGLLINWPYHNFQDFLAQGDHGRDLYAAQAVLRGEVPYKDFWWVYGPLMPYYYGLFFKFFGMTIPSVLLGKLLLNVAAGAFFYLALSRLFSPVLAGIGAVWFMTFHSDFFFTYNHAGGIALMLAAVWAAFGYIKMPRIAWAWAALSAVFILGLVKINFALTSLIMTVLAVAAVDYLQKIPFNLGKKSFYTAAILLVPLLWVGIYALLLQGLSMGEIRQCLPYLGGDEPYNRAGPLQTVPILVKHIWSNIRQNVVHGAMAVLTILCSLRTIHILATQRTEYHLKVLIGLAYLAFFYVLNLHEFLKSGVFYRSFWSQPLSMMMIFAVLAFATARLDRWVRWLLWAALGIILLLSNFNNYQHIKSLKNGQHFLGGPRGQVYIGNNRLWIQTVVLTTRQLQTMLKDGGTFFALPYDCLYYYLAEKPSPTRQLILFDHINIAPQQEQSIIAQLEANRVGIVLVSSRQSAREQGLGTLGVTYCPFIAQYINTNFVPVAKFGDWSSEPGWAWNHGTLLLKRK